MAGLQLEGDLSQISDKQLEFIKSAIEKQGYKNNKVIFEPVGKAGDNYVASVKRVIIEDEDRGNFKLIAKIAPQHELMRQMSNTNKLFGNEHIMYMKVLPKFTELEKIADIPPKDRLRYAACYGSYEEAPNEVILLEDLNAAEYTMLDKFQSLSDECVKSILRDFASLHSLSYALKFKEPELYEEYANSLFDMWSNVFSQEQAQMFLRQMEGSATAVVQSDIYRKAIKGSVSIAVQNYIKLAKSDKKSKSSVIVQGDAWTNNIMFKFEGEKLLGSAMIDYQASKPGNPVFDLLYMIFTCVDYESRKQHFYDWIDYYHNELDRALSNHGLKANFIFSKDQLDVDLKRYGKAAFGQAVMSAGMLSMNAEDAGNFREAIESSNLDEISKKSDASTKNAETVAIYRQRLEGLVDSFHEFGLL